MGTDNKKTVQPYIASTPILPGVSINKPLFQNSLVVNFKNKHSIAHLANGYKIKPAELTYKIIVLYLKVSSQER